MERLPSSHNSSSPSVVPEDVTDLRRAQETLKDLANAMSDLVWIADGFGQVLFFNVQVSNFEGIYLSENGQWSWSDLIHPDDFNDTQVKWSSAVLSGEPYSIEHRVKTKMSGYRWHRSCGYPKKSSGGKIITWFGITTDIHEQKIVTQKMELLVRERTSALSTSLQILEQAEIAARIGHWTWNLNTNSHYWSPNLYKVLGHNPTELNPSFENFLKIIHPDDRQSVMASGTSAMERHQVSDEIFRIITSDGEQRFIRGVGSLHQIDGCEYIIGTSQDVTQLMQVQNELKRSNDDLLQFAHIASHDLREPIRKIKTYLDRVQSEMHLQWSIQSEKYISKIFQSADRMSAMIDGVLVYSSIPESDVVEGDVDLNELFEAIEEDLELLIQEKKAVILRNPLCIIRGSSALLTRMFYNLLSNALKFSKTGIPPKIVIECKTTDSAGLRFVEIVIKDNGIGFNQEFAEKIFAPFLRLHAKDKYEGAGIGLAISKKIAERHGGSIRAVGTINEGAEFYVLIPERKPDSETDRVSEQ